MKQEEAVNGNNKGSTTEGLLLLIALVIIELVACGCLISMVAAAVKWVIGC